MSRKMSVVHGAALVLAVRMANEAIGSLPSS